MSKTEIDKPVIFAVDPGNLESAYVLLDPQSLQPLAFGKVSNGKLMALIGERAGQGDWFVIEMVASYGMAVGKEVFETVFWIGRFWEAACCFQSSRIYRREVKMHLCGHVTAKDGNIMQALVDRFAYGVPNRGKGVKVAPGWFYGFSKDVWQAYALGVTFGDLRLRGEVRNEA